MSIPKTALVLCWLLSATVVSNAQMPNVSPQVRTRATADGKVTVVEIAAHFVTAIRLPETVNSVAVGDLLLAGWEAQGLRFTTASTAPVRYGWKALPALPVQKKSFSDGLAKPVSSFNDSRKKRGTSPSSPRSSLMNPVGSISSASAGVSTVTGNGLPVSKCGIGSCPESRRLSSRVSNIL